MEHSHRARDAGECVRVKEAGDIDWKRNPRAEEPAAMMAGRD
jgi:hypothetical protein